MKSQAEVYADALRRIAAPTYGTEIHDTDAERADHYWRLLEIMQLVARQALAPQPASEPKPTPLLGDIHEIQRIEDILRGKPKPEEDPADGC